MKTKPAHLTIGGGRHAATLAGFEDAHVFSYEAWFSYLDMDCIVEMPPELNKGWWHVLASRGEIVARRRTLRELAATLSTRSHRSAA